MLIRAEPPTHPRSGLLGLCSKLAPEELEDIRVMRRI
jgi:hypothetical protein